MNFKTKIKMKKIVCLVSVSALLLASCSKPFKKSPDGTEYKLVANEKGKKAVKGGFMELNILVKYKDSVVFSTIEMGGPKFIPYDTARLPVFFKNTHEGDSIVIKTSIDTLIKRGQSEPYMKKGQFLYQYVKVAKVYSTTEEAQAAAKVYEKATKAIAYKKTIEQVEKQLATAAPQLKIDDVVIADYLVKNNLKATKTKWGTYVVVTTPGTGGNLTENDIAEVNYTGRNLKDSVFDSNTDPRFGHIETYPVKLDEFGVIPGWIDGLKMMQKGSTGKLIIPSSLAYGKEGKGGNIGPNEILVFDINVVNVLNEQQYEEKQQAMQQQMMEKQQAMMKKMKEEQQRKTGKADAENTKKNN